MGRRFDPDRAHESQIKKLELYESGARLGGEWTQDY